MKKLTNRTPTYIFIMVAVLVSWGLAFAKALVTQTYPQISISNLQLGDLQYQFIFAFLFQ
jgi:hypothetical protein